MFFVPGPRLFSFLHPVAPASCRVEKQNLSYLTKVFMYVQMVHTALALQVCCENLPQTRWLKTTDTYSYTHCERILKPSILKSRWRQMVSSAALSRNQLHSSPGFRWFLACGCITPASSLPTGPSSLHLSSSLSLKSSSSFSYEDTSHQLQDPA